MYYFRTLAFHSNSLYFGGISTEETLGLLHRPNQIQALDFVGCVKVFQVNGIEQKILEDGGSLHVEGVSPNCNQMEGGACNIGNECGSQGIFTILIIIISFAFPVTFIFTYPMPFSSLPCCFRYLSPALVPPQMLVPWPNCRPQL